MTGVANRALAPLTLLASGHAGTAPAATLAERPGHPAGAKLVIVHADDPGEWHGVNAAPILAVATGLISSGVAMPGARDTVDDLVPARTDQRKETHR